MKKCVWLLLFVTILGFSFQGKAQSEEAQQLLLNVEKLAQLRQMLADLKNGYQILFEGYNTIKNISEGSFKLHKTFLDGLLEVSPAVRNYYKVAGIVSSQITLVKEYKAAIRHFIESKQFAPDEISYLEHVYQNILEKSLKNLDALATILTEGKLRMSDEERLQAIDTIYSDMQEKLTFLRHFNNKNKVLALQRAHEQSSINRMKKLYGVH